MLEEAAFQGVNSSFKSTDKKRKTFWFTLLPFIEVSNLSDIKTVNIFSRTADSKLVVNLKTADIWVVKCSNTNDTNISERSTCFT